MPEMKCMVLRLRLTRLIGLHGLQGCYLNDLAYIRSDPGGIPWVYNNTKNEKLLLCSA